MNDTTTLVAHPDRAGEMGHHAGASADAGGDVAALTAEVRALLVDAVALLSHMAGEGMGFQSADRLIFADDVLYKLAGALFPEWDGDCEYPDLFRSHLLSQTTQEDAR